MSRTFVSDPREVVKSGDVVKVKVLDVDVERQRIGLTLRLDDEVGAAAGPKGGQGARGPRQGGQRGGGQRQGGQRQGGQSRDRRSDARPASGSMADALRKAGFGK
jgi:protein Tex